MLAKLRKRMYLAQGSLDFFGMFRLNELSAETIAIFSFVSLWRRESSHRTRFQDRYL